MGSIDPSASNVPDPSITNINNINNENNPKGDSSTNLDATVSTANNAINNVLETATNLTPDPSEVPTPSDPTSTSDTSSASTTDAAATTSDTTSTQNEALNTYQQAQANENTSYESEVSGMEQADEEMKKDEAETETEHKPFVSFVCASTVMP